MWPRATHAAIVQCSTVRSTGRRVRAPLAATATTTWRDTQKPRSVPPRRVTCKTRAAKKQRRNNQFQKQQIPSSCATAIPTQSIPPATPLGTRLRYAAAAVDCARTASLARQRLLDLPRCSVAPRPRGARPPPRRPRRVHGRIEGRPAEPPPSPHRLAPPLGAAVHPSSGPRPPDTPATGTRGRAAVGWPHDRGRRGHQCQRFSRRHGQRSRHRHARGWPTPLPPLPPPCGGPRVANRPMAGSTAIGAPQP